MNRNPFDELDEEYAAWLRLLKAAYRRMWKTWLR